MIQEKNVRVNVKWHNNLGKMTYWIWYLILMNKIRIRQQQHVYYMHIIQITLVMYIYI